MQPRYAYKYALIDETTGECLEVRDSSNYVLDPGYVPIPTDDIEYLLKYYWPIPDTVNSFDDFHGQWYEDEAHTIPWSPEV